MEADGIHCNAFPGMIDTMSTIRSQLDAVRGNVEHSIPMRRPDHPDDCGATVVHLAFDKFAFTTGASININSGMFFF